VYQPGVETVVSGLSSPALKVVHVGLHKTRVSELLAAFGDERRWFVPNNSIQNLSEAILQRVLFHKEGELFVPPAPPQPNAVAELLKFRELVLALASPTSVSSYESCVEKYTGCKRLRYQRAMESLEKYPLKESDAHVDAFVKLEKIKPGGVPRVVSPRRPRYNLELMRTLKEQEHKMFRAVDQVFGEPTILKSYNAKERADIIAEKWSKYKDPVAIGYDAIRFDQHVSKEMLQYEHEFYIQNAVKHRRSFLRKILSWQLNNKVYAKALDGTAHYITMGGRMSGDMNTSLGNCLISCAMAFTYFDKRGLRASLCNDGDDCLMIMEWSTYKKMISGGEQLSDFMGRMGFLVEIEKPVRELERAVFCQTQVCQINGKPLAVRDPKRVLTRDSHCVRPRHSSVGRRRWFRGVGEAGLATYGAVPVLGAYYDAMVRNAGKVKAAPLRDDEGMFYLSCRMHEKRLKPDVEARIGFWVAFGACPASQLLMEDYFDKLEVGFDTDESGIVFFAPTLNLVST